MGVLRDKSGWCFCSGGGKSERLKVSIFSGKSLALASICGGGTGFLIHRNLLLTTHANIPSVAATEVRVHHGRVLAHLVPHSYGRGKDAGPPKYDSGEIPRNHIPLLTHSQILSGELPGASPDMSPGGGGGGKRMHPLPYAHSPNPSREFSGDFGNVAWKERVDGWKMKQEKNVGPMTNGTSHPLLKEGELRTLMQLQIIIWNDALLCQRCE